MVCKEPSTRTTYIGQFKCIGSSFPLKELITIHAKPTGKNNIGVVTGLVKTKFDANKVSII